MRARDAGREVLPLGAVVDRLTEMPVS
jgi:hypothetical protein